MLTKKEIKRMITINESEREALRVYRKRIITELYDGDPESKHYKVLKELLKRC
jgi:hypothetical protein